MHITPKNTLILFDIVGVLINPSRVITGLLSKIANATPECIHKYYDRYVIGQISHNAFWDGVKTCIDQSQRINKTKDIDTLKIEQQFYAKRIINKDVVSLAQNIQTIGFDIGILSNHTKDWALHDITVFNHFNLSFKYIFVSALIGISKPDPKIFTYVKNHIDKRYSNIILIDDKMQNVKIAQQNGFTAILYPFKQKSKTFLNSLITLK